MRRLFSIILLSVLVHAAHNLLPNNIIPFEGRAQCYAASLGTAWRDGQQRALELQQLKILNYKQCASTCNMIFDDCASAYSSSQGQDSEQNKEQIRTKCIPDAENCRENCRGFLR